MVCEKIIRVLQQQSPESYALDYDNVGLLVGSEKKEVNHVYIALDATEETIQEAVRAGADLLLTHHPLIFKGLKKVNTQDFIGRRVIELIKRDIAYYAMHTNFDVLGMAGLAAEKMKLQDASVLQVTCRRQEREEGVGRTGRLPKEMTLAQCAEYVKQVFDLSQVRVYGDLNQKILRAAICPGSGKSVISDALNTGAQVLITGDIDHHEGIDGAARGLCIIDGGHYGLEKIFIPYMQKYLKEQIPELRVTAQEPKQPFVSL